MILCSQLQTRAVIAFPYKKSVNNKVGENLDNKIKSRKTSNFIISGLKLLVQVS